MLRCRGIALNSQVAAISPDNPLPGAGRTSAPGELGRFPARFQRGRAGLPWRGQPHHL